MVSERKVARPRHPLRSKMQTMQEATVESTSVACLVKGVFGALKSAGLGSLCDADVPQGSQMDIGCLHLPVKLLLLRRDPKML